MLENSLMTMTCDTCSGWDSVEFSIMPYLNNFPFKSVSWSMQKMKNAAFSNILGVLKIVIHELKQSFQNFVLRDYTTILNHFPTFQIKLAISWYESMG